MVNTQKALNPDRVEELRAVLRLRASQLARIVRAIMGVITGQVEWAARRIDNRLDVSTLPSEELERFLEMVAASVGRTFARRIVEGTGTEDVFRSTWGDRVATYIRETAGTKIRGINDTTLEMVRTVLNEGAESGIGSRDIARNLRKQWTELGRYRSELIARTEIVAASNFGHHAGAEHLIEQGFELEKEWIAAIDGRTRESHAAADGVTVLAQEAFQIGSARLRFPGDSSLGAPASEIINCRCTVAYLVIDDEHN